MRQLLNFDKIRKIHIKHPSPAIYFVSPAVIILVITALFPILYALFASFNRTSLLGGDVEFVGFSYYIRAFSDSRFWSSIFTTFSLGIPSLLLEITIGFSIALLFNKQIKMLKILRPLTFLPMMITPVVVGMMWAVMLNPDFGIINYLLSVIGINPIYWLADPVYSKIALILTNVWEWTPFSVLVLLAALQGLPEDPFKAALVDGATKGQIFRRLTLPLLKPVIVVIILIRTIWLLQLFDIVNIITAGGPGASTETISLFIYKQAFLSYEISYASTLSIVFLIVTIITCTVILKIAEDK